MSFQSNEPDFLLHVSSGNLEKPFLNTLSYIKNFLFPPSEAQKITENLNESIQDLDQSIDKEILFLQQETSVLGDEINLQKGNIYEICKSLEESIEKSKYFLDSLNSSKFLSFSVEKTKGKF